jgi:hypothetical protein
LGRGFARLILDYAMILVGDLRDLGERAALAVALARQSAILLIDERNRRFRGAGTKSTCGGYAWSLGRGRAPPTHLVTGSDRAIETDLISVSKKIVSRLLEEDALRRRRLADLQQE